MSGSNPNSTWNQFGTGPTPMTGDEVFLASANDQVGATMYNYTTSMLLAYLGTALLSSPTPIGDVEPNTGAFTTLAAESATFSGAISGPTASFVTLVGDTVGVNTVLGFASGATITSGTDAPSSTQPAGSLYLRAGGSSGSRLYISAGAGSWNAVAGV